MVEAGDTATDFTLRGTDGETISQYTLSEYTAQGFVVLSFYMNDFSPVCSKQMCELDDIDLFQFEDEVTMFGISPDYVYSHREYSQQKDLTYPLLSDPQFEVARQYGVYDGGTDVTEPSVRRSVFLIDADRRVRYRWVAEDNWDDWNHEATEELKDNLDRLRV
jgi:peroxiredoxin